MGDEQELQHLAERLAGRILQGLGTRSRWALKVGLDAADAEGIRGLVTIRIPARVKDQVDVDFVSGITEVTTKWE